jgi:hypothetical protein
MTPLKLHTGNIIDIFSPDTETELELPRQKYKTERPPWAFALWRLNE